MWLWKKILTRNSSSGGNNSILRLKKKKNKKTKNLQKHFERNPTQIRPKPNLFLIRKVHGNPHPNILLAVISIHPLKWWFTARSGWVLRTRFAEVKLGLRGEYAMMLDWVCCSNLLFIKSDEYVAWQQEPSHGQNFCLFI